MWPLPVLVQFFKWLSHFGEQASSIRLVLTKTGVVGTLTTQCSWCCTNCISCIGGSFLITKLNSARVDYWLDSIVLFVDHPFFLNFFAYLLFLLILMEHTPMGSIDDCVAFTFLATELENKIKRQYQSRDHDKLINVHIGREELSASEFFFYQTFLELWGLVFLHAHSLKLDEAQTN